MKSENNDECGWIVLFSVNFYYKNKFTLNLTKSLVEYIFFTFTLFKRKENIDCTYSTFCWSKNVFFSCFFSIFPLFSFTLVYSNITNQTRYMPKNAKKLSDNESKTFFYFHLIGWI